ncbi:MAG: S-layer domain protein, partial [Paenibacillus sp.]|nr:S-layer domain protein [Paenibacillus sp.]
GADPEAVYAGAVVESNGSIRYVPAKIVEKDGRHYAEIASLTNSLYAIVQGGAGSFSDTVGHWSEQSVAAMAARFIAKGKGEGSFMPDSEVKRSEFAAMVVRALGLKHEGGSGTFEDVAAGAWYANDVATAASYELIGGYGDGTFGPSDAVTREQAISILARAAEWTGLRESVADADTQAQLPSAFQDGADVSDWARRDVAFGLEHGILKGRSDTALAPGATVTRAEAIVMIERLLAGSNLI